MSRIISSRSTRPSSQTATIAVPHQVLAVVVAIVIAALLSRPTQVADHGGQNHSEQHITVCS